MNERSLKALSTGPTMLRIPIEGQRTRRSTMTLQDRCHDMLPYPGWPMLYYRPGVETNFAIFTQHAGSRLSGSPQLNLIYFPSV